MDGSPRYTEIAVLGEGSCGRVVMAFDGRGTKWAVKGMHEEELDVIRREARIMEKLCHPSIVRYRESYQQPDGSFFIVMEFAQGGTLYDRIHDDDDEPLPESTIVDWLCQLCLALRYLHGKGIMHRDLKTQNIYLSSKGRIKLGDFGIAKSLSGGESTAKSYVGTPLYLAPEVIRRTPYTTKCDMWSLGVVLYEMMNRLPPFRGCSLDAVAQAIAVGEYAPLSSIYSKCLISIVEGLLCSNPSLRLSPDEVLATKLCRASMKALVESNIKKKVVQPFMSITRQNIRRDVPKTLYDCRIAETVCLDNVSLQVEK